MARWQLLMIDGLLKGARLTNVTANALAVPYSLIE